MNIDKQFAKCKLLNANLYSSLRILRWGVLIQLIIALNYLKIDTIKIHLLSSPQIL
jgi:hypothetical protein